MNIYEINVLIAELEKEGEYKNRELLKFYRNKRSELLDEIQAKFEEILSTI